MRNLIHLLNFTLLALQACVLAALILLLLYLHSGLHVAHEAQEALLMGRLELGHYLSAANRAQPPLSD